MATDRSVLDAFTAAIAANDPDRAEPLHLAAEARFSPYDEKDLLRRAITAASRAASKATGESPRDSLISSGNGAYTELDRRRPWPEDEQPQAVIGQLKNTLELVSAELGPFRGGQTGQIKEPAGQPHIVPEHHPSPEAVIEMARSAGVVVGLAGAAGAVDWVAELRGVMDGCPVCASEVAEQEAQHQEIAPKQGPVIECGECELGHQLEREENEPGPWRPVRKSPWGSS